MNNFHLTKIRQHFRNNSLEDVRGELSKELIKLAPFINPGANIGIAVGSRGVQNLVLVVREVADFIRNKKAYPYIVPAMGSHGDATAKGQAGILECYGISEKTTGAPVRSSMEVVELPQGDVPNRIFMDKNVYESDGVILINRVKPHTDFHGRYESGLVKMSVIGLGKEKQATAIHSYGVYGLANLIRVTAKQIFLTNKILGGIALIENAFHETMLVKALKTDDFFEQEPALLDIARENMPSLPVDDIDILVIDQMGKDISGVGIDPNIIGRTGITGQKDPDKPRIKAIAVLDLTAGSHGNAFGIGLSNIITKRLYDKIDFNPTYANGVISSFIERAKLPIVAKNGTEAFEIALRSCAYIKKDEERIIRIKDTLHLDELYVAKAVFDSIKDMEGIELIEKDVIMLNGVNEFVPF